MSERASVDPRIERTRRVVLEATAELVGECGPSRTTIEGIAERSGVARSTIYRHWPQPELLLVEAVDSCVAPMAVPDTGSLREDLITVFTALLDMLSSEPVGSVVASVLLESRRDPHLAAVHERFTSARRERVVAIIQRGIERGDLPSKVDSEAIIHALAGPVFYRALVLRQSVDDDFVTDLVDDVLARHG
jgi:AcrR family transcriptional regulator